MPSEPASNVVVLGADGTLGALLAKRLGARGMVLRCPSMNAESPLDLAGARVVVNATGPRARKGLGWPDYFREHVGTTRAIAAALPKGGRLIQLSSTSVFGGRGTTIPEGSLEAPVRFPLAAYASAKYAAEMTARAVCHERGVSLEVLRLSMVYGPHIDSALETLRKLAARGIRLDLLPGTARQHLLHEDLLIAAIQRLLERGIANGPPLVLADPFLVTNAELRTTLAKRFPRARGFPVPLGLMRRVLSGWERLLDGQPPLSVASFDVLGIDNEFDWRPAFNKLGLIPSDFSRERTFDPYFQ